MAARKKSAHEKELKATVKKLRSKLKKAEASSEQWKKKADRRKEALARSERQVKKLSKRLEKAAPAEPSSSAAPDASASTTPDASWTVAQLRAEARSRGVTGFSNKPKADLLKALG